MLTGSELLAFVQANPDLNQQELAREAGYVRTTEGGKEQVLTKRFYQALLNAKGVDLKVGKAPGKTAGYETSVHASGVVLLGKTYIQEFGIQPGDVLTIKLEEDCIKLIPKNELVAA